MTFTTLLLTVVDTVSILFIGDVMQHEAQLHSARLDGADATIASSYDYSSYFRYVRPIIEEADFAAANMEFCLGGPPFTGYPSFSAPESLAEEAANSGIDLFLCANNHICDKGRRGLLSSLEKYSGIGTPFTGIYRDSLDEAASNPYITEIRGIRIAFVNFTYGTNGIKVPEPMIVNTMDEDAVRTAIDRAEKSDADIIIAIPHWGPEYVTEPSSAQRDWAKKLLQWGADAVIGSHPHVVQPVELPVVYSLGNFISNMSLRNTELGLAYRLDIAVTLSGLAFLCGGEAIPLWSSRSGGYAEEFTVLPVKQFLGKRDEFINKHNYDKMKDTYYRLRHLFEK